jgi:hypothetical protein
VCAAAARPVPNDAERGLVATPFATMLSCCYPGITRVVSCADNLTCSCSEFRETEAAICSILLLFFVTVSPKETSGTLPASAAEILRKVKLSVHD